MIVVRKYFKDGNSECKEFDNKLAAFLWLNDNLAESEWFCVMYMKDGDKK